MIKTIRKLKKGVIHFLGMVKMDKRLYEYQGQKLNAKELKQQLKSKMKRAKKLNIYYIELIVNYSDIGPVKLFFTIPPMGTISRASEENAIERSELKKLFRHKKTQALKI